MQVFSCESQLCVFVCPSISLSVGNTFYSGGDSRLGSTGFGHLLVLNFFFLAIFLFDKELTFRID